MGSKELEPDSCFCQGRVRGPTPFAKFAWWLYLFGPHWIPRSRLGKSFRPSSRDLPQRPNQGCPRHVGPSGSDRTRFHDPPLRISRKDRPWVCVFASWIRHGVWCIYTSHRSLMLPTSFGHSLPDEGDASCPHTVSWNNSVSSTVLHSTFTISSATYSMRGNTGNGCWTFKGMIWCGSLTIWTR